MTESPKPEHSLPSWINRPWKYCPLCAGDLTERVIETKKRLTCSNCGFVHYQNPKVAVVVVVVKDGKLLLDKRDIEPQRGEWSFPSGYVDIGETVEEAAVREASEETGLGVRLDRLVGVYSSKDRPVVLVVFGASVVSGDLETGDESQDVRFFDLDKLPELAFPHDMQILQDCLNLRGRPLCESCGDAGHDSPASGQGDEDNEGYLE